MTRPGIEPRSPGPLANTLLIRPMARKLINLKKYITEHIFLNFTIICNGIPSTRVTPESLFSYIGNIYIYIYIYIYILCVYLTSRE